MKERIEKKEKKEAEPIVKKITPDEKQRMLIEGIKKTVVPAFIGAFFALLFFLKFGNASQISWFPVILLVVLVSYYIQRILYPQLGVRVNEFEMKDWIYVEFLIVIYLLVFWTLLLN